MFAAAMDGLMDGWICSPFIVLDGPPRNHLHPVPVLSCVYPSLWEHVLTS
jgi:hypothetical protein